MALVNTSVHMGGQAPQNGCHQGLCLSVSSSCLLLLWETLQDQDVGLIQAPYCHLPWFQQQTRFVSALSEWSLYFPQSSESPENKHH